MEQGYSSLVRSGYLTPDQLHEFARIGAVGDVCALHFDIDGNLLDIPLQRRLVTIDAETLRRAPLRLGIAAGHTKAKPILGAMRAGLINALVTNETAASLVLQLEDQ